MNLEHDLPTGKVLIYRESNYRRSYFSFWVGADKSSWTMLRESAHKFADTEKAEAAITEIKRRNKVRRAVSR
jgi:hypothetical protein